MKLRPLPHRDDLLLEQILEDERTDILLSMAETNAAADPAQV